MSILTYLIFVNDSARFLTKSGIPPLSALDVSSILISLKMVKRDDGGLSDVEVMPVYSVARLVGGRVVMFGMSVSVSIVGRDRGSPASGTRLEGRRIHAPTSVRYVTTKETFS